ncbi:pyruvate dehydrogenase E3 (dihydrolipoamide dehydrogenase) [Sorangium cellulosum So ce56]|uniref:Dihydrolipoyl dehydrogenase n=1 Tax=Sorangium cellulosum (strain So ce56) TaxID=448385 RepID=A9FH02_SORC5|nr:dihydrolipoyl dehydrogenase [Sorangium cellulosum]CAN98170.1 pyruvate dehydrogenase E3 (dihydrolipoamide dehydrogenase) [Sorangium cellulosum So ce56]
MKTYDAIVIGAGPGGYPCAIRLAQLKQKVLCIEKENVGGVCLNWGCIPSKALISAAHLYEKSQAGAAMGIKVSGVELDANKMQDWKEGIVKKLTGGVGSLLKGNGADVVNGTATVVGPKRVDVTRADGSVEQFEATKAIVIATGSTTIEIPTFKFDGDTIIGAKEAVSLRRIPKRLMVIGGGVIGLELGMVYQAFGAELIVVEALPELLTGVDPDCTKIVERKILKRGGTIHKNAKALGYEKQKDGSVGVKILADGKEQTIVVDTVLVAVGMRPSSKGLGLEKVGVTVDQRGFVPTDKFCRTNVPSIYAIGDVSGPPLLAHKATKEGEIAAEVIAGHKAEKDWVAIPGAIFTDPEIATVGLTEAEAKAKGLEVSIGKFPFSVLGKAMAMNETEGFVKIVADKKTKQVLGVHIVGPEASTMISEASLSLEMAAFLEDLSLTIHPHPTLGESLMEAAAHAMGAAIHIANR